MRMFVLFQHPRPFVVGAVFRPESETFVSEVEKSFGRRGTRGDEVAGEGASHHFGIDHDGFEAVALVDVKLGRDDTHVLCYAFPIEKTFHFGTGGVDENTIVGLNAFDEEIGKERTPELEDALAVVVGQLDVAFETIVFDFVERTIQSVEERGNPKMLLRITKVGFRKFLGERPSLCKKARPQVGVRGRGNYDSVGQLVRPTSD